MAVIARGQITLHIAEKGDPGTSQFIHIRYSANSNGNPMTTTPSAYIGIAINTSATAPTSYASYIWSRLQGLTGSNGINGSSSYLHIRYSKNANGNPMVTTPDNFIGTAVTTSPTAPTSFASYSWARFQTDPGDMNTGRMLHRDPEFRQGSNSVAVYNNAGNGMVTHSRITRPSDCPTTSTHCLQITHTGAASPGLGGFYQLIYTRANAIFIQRFVAKLPVGYKFYTAANSMGTGAKDQFLTSAEGTGKYEVYVRRIDSGSSGSFSSTGFVYVSGTPIPTVETPMVWYLASCTAYDLTDTEKYDDQIKDAKLHTRALCFRGNFSTTTVYYNYEQRQDCVKYGSTYYLYIGTNGASGAWNSANWKTFGSQFTSVATNLLLAQLAYIENLGVRNLMTSTSGQRIEITAARNSMAFYTAAQSTPVLEIKTTSDGVYMGQGAGFQIKQSGVNISMFKGYLHQGSEGSGISVPVLPWGQPETISQLCILQSFTNSNTTKYKNGIYIDISGTQGTTSTSDRLNGIFISSGGMFIAGDYTKNRSNNVLCGVTCAGKVSQSGSLLRSWVISYMGGYLSCSRTGQGRYRIYFSNTSYLRGDYDYSVILMTDAPHSSGKHGAYACTMARTSSYFDVWTSDDETTNDCGFTFIVIITNKYF